jgi:hypothetical protein
MLGAARERRRAFVRCLKILVSPLFRKSEKKVAEQAAAQAEIERLKALSVEDLAVALLPCLGPDGANQGNSVRGQQLCDYLVRDFPGAGRLQPLQLMARVSEALDKLKQAELVASISHQRLPVWRLTHLGQTMLAEGTIEQHVRKAR